jgi:hypothetical protein
VVAAFSTSGDFFVSEKVTMKLRTFALLLLLVACTAFFLLDYFHNTSQPIVERVTYPWER